MLNAPERSGTLRTKMSIGFNNLENIGDLSDCHFRGVKMEVRS